MARSVKTVRKAKRHKHKEIGKVVITSHLKQPEMLAFLLVSLVIVLIISSLIFLPEQLDKLGIPVGKFTLESSQPDLVAGLECTNTNLGQRIYCTAVVKNSGKTTTGTFFTEWFLLSQNQVFANRQIMIERLAPGESKTIIVDATDLITLHGDYEAKIVADSTGEINEPRKINNLASVKFTVS